jgi:hypothetical protein
MSLMTRACQLHPFAHSDPALHPSWTFDDEDEIATLVIATTKVTVHLTVDGGAYRELRLSTSPPT